MSFSGLLTLSLGHFRAGCNFYIQIGVAYFSNGKVLATVQPEGRITEGSGSYGRTIANVRGCGSDAYIAAVIINSQYLVCSYRIPVEHLP